MRLRRGLFVFSLLLAVYSASVGANVDLLLMPARPSANATHSLLLDVQRVGASLFAVGEFGQVLKSTNNGKTWQAGQAPTSITLTALAFSTDKEGYAVGHDGVVLHTVDGGIHWQKVLDGNAINTFVLQAAQAKVNALKMQLDALSNDQSDQRHSLEKTLDDANFSVNTAKDDLKVGPSKPLLDVAILPSGTVFVVGAYGQLLKSNDHGKSWQYLGAQLDNPNNYHLNALLVGHQGDLYVAGEQGSVFLSHDEGTTWQAKKIDYTGSIFSLIETEHTHTLLALGLRGHLFKQLAGSEQWQAIDTGVKETLSAAMTLTDGSIVVVGARGILLRTQDEFQTFKAVRRDDKRSSAGLAQLDAQTILLCGAGGLISLPLSIFK